MLYTDGLLEAMNSEKELFDEDRLVKSVEVNVNGDTKGMRDAIMKDVLAWNDGAILDDMTLLVIRREK